MGDRLGIPGVVDLNFFRIIFILYLSFIILQSPYYFNFILVSCKIVVRTRRSPFIECNNFGQLIGNRFILPKLFTDVPLENGIAVSIAALLPREPSLSGDRYINRAHSRIPQFLKLQNTKCVRFGSGEYFFLIPPLPPG